MITAEEDTTSIENEHILAESTIEQEKNKTEELESQIKALEERLVQGGGGKDLINNLNETQQILEQRNLEIAERKKREVEMQQKIDLEEETTAIVTNTFATLQQEVDHKTQRYRRSCTEYIGDVVEKPGRSTITVPQVKEMSVEVRVSPGGGRGAA